MHRRELEFRENVTLAVVIKCEGVNLDQKFSMNRSPPKTIINQTEISDCVGACSIYYGAKNCQQERT